MKRDIKMVAKDFADYLSTPPNAYLTFDYYTSDETIYIVSPEYMYLPVIYEGYPVVKMNREIEPL